MRLSVPRNERARHDKQPNWLSKHAGYNHHTAEATNPTGFPVHNAVGFEKALSNPALWPPRMIVNIEAMELRCKQNEQQRINGSPRGCGLCTCGYMPVVIQYVLSLLQLQKQDNTPKEQRNLIFSEMVPPSCWTTANLLRVNFKLLNETGTVRVV
jgi:hypothetical protein